MTMLGSLVSDSYLTQVRKGDGDGDNEDDDDQAMGLANACYCFLIALYYGQTWSMLFPLCLPGQASCTHCFMSGPLTPHCSPP